VSPQDERDLMVALGTMPRPVQTRDLRWAVGLLLAAIAAGVGAIVSLAAGDWLFGIIGALAAMTAMTFALLEFSRPPARRKAGR
jgi:1,4-dihydroxy-2-naphthoate octaprenyltransferase